MLYTVHTDARVGHAVRVTPRGGRRLFDGKTIRRDPFDGQIIACVQRTKDDPKQYVVLPLHDEAAADYYATAEELV